MSDPIVIAVISCALICVPLLVAVLVEYIAGDDHETTDD